MKLSKKISFLSLSVLALSVASPLTTLADSSNSATQTAAAINTATQGNTVQVQDAKVNQTVSTAGGALDVTLLSNLSSWTTIKTTPTSRLTCQMNLIQKQLIQGLRLFTKATTLTLDFKKRLTVSVH